MEVVVYLIIVVIVMMVKASSKNKKTTQNRPGAPVQNRQGTARNAQPAKKPLTQDEIRKAAELLIKKQPAKPAQPTVKVKTPLAAAAQPAVKFNAPELAHEAFSEGMSFGDEGVDPCHAEMYEKRTPLPDPGTAVPAIQIQFTPNSVLNGVIMSEVLTRRV